MNRRHALQQIAGGGVLLTTGCTTILESPGPFHFAIVNHRQQHYHVEFTVWDDGDEVLIDGAVDVAPRPPDDGEYTALDFPDLTQVTNGDIIDAQILVADRTLEKSFEVMCNRSENTPNNLFFHIRHPDAPSSSDSAMEFRGSKC